MLSRFDEDLQFSKLLYLVTDGLTVNGEVVNIFLSDQNWLTKQLRFSRSFAS